MLLYQIIEQNDQFLNGEDVAPLSYGQIAPYRKLLRAYYGPSIIMVDFLTNAIQAGYIVPAENFSEVVNEHYTNADERETVEFNSVLL